MLWWPAGLQLTFFISAMISGAQATLFRNAWFRNLVGIQPLAAPSAPKPQSRTHTVTSNRYQAPSSGPSTPSTPKGVFENFKGAVSDLMKAGRKYAPVSRQRAQNERLTPAEKQHAKRYEERRTREIARDAEMKREAAQARFEKQQEQGVREQERKERLQRRAEKKAKRRE